MVSCFYVECFHLYLCTTLPPSILTTQAHCNPFFNRRHSASVGITYNPTESPIRHFVIAEESYARDDEAKAVCCLARTAKCMSCSRGISVEAFCALEPQVPGCSSPKDPKRSATVEQHLVDIVLQIHHPKHAIGIFEGKSDVTRELQASMQASVSVLNYADPDMSVKSVQVETTLMPGAQRSNRWCIFPSQHQALLMPKPWLVFSRRALRYKRILWARPSLMRSMLPK